MFGRATAHPLQTKKTFGRSGGRYYLFLTNKRDFILTVLHRELSRGAPTMNEKAFFETSFPLSEAVLKMFLCKPSCCHSEPTFLPPLAYFFCRPERSEGSPPWGRHPERSEGCLANARQDGVGEFFETSFPLLTCLQD